MRNRASPVLIEMPDLSDSESTCPADFSGFTGEEFLEEEEREEEEADSLKKVWDIVYGLAAKLSKQDSKQSDLEEKLAVQEGELKQLRSQVRVLEGKNVQEDTGRTVIERQNDQAAMEIRELREKSQTLEQVNRRLEEERIAIKLQMEEYELNAKKQEEAIAKFKEEQKEWSKKIQEEGNVKLKEIIEQEKKDSQERTEREFVKVLKKKETLVRGIVDKKKCVIIKGLSEMNMPTKEERLDAEWVEVMDIVTYLLDGDYVARTGIEEVVRLGKYDEGRIRPLRVKFASQNSVEEIMLRTGKLARSRNYYNIWIKRDANEEEREKERELIMEAKERNEQRSEEEERNFYWKVRGMRVMKWYFSKEPVRGY